MNTEIQRLQAALRSFSVNARKLSETTFPPEEKYIIKNDLIRLAQNELNIAVFEHKKLMERFG